MIRREENREKNADGRSSLFLTGCTVPYLTAALHKEKLEA